MKNRGSSAGFATCGAVLTGALVLAGCSGADDDPATTDGAQAPMTEAAPATGESPEGTDTPSETSAETATDEPSNEPTVDPTPDGEAVDPYLIPDLPTEPTELWAVEVAEVPDYGEGRESTRPAQWLVPTNRNTVLANLGRDVALLDLDTGAELWRRTASDAPEDRAYASDPIGSTDRFVGIVQPAPSDVTYDALILDLDTGDEVSRLTLRLADEAQSALAVLGDHLILTDTNLDYGDETETRTQTHTLLDPVHAGPEWTLDFEGTRGLNSALGFLPDLTPTSDPAQVRVSENHGDDGSTWTVVDVEQGGVVSETTWPGLAASNLLGAWDRNLLVGNTPTTVTGWSLIDGSELWTVEADYTGLVDTSLTLRTVGTDRNDTLGGVFTADGDPGTGQAALTRHDPATGETLWSQPPLGAWALDAAAEPTLDVLWADDTVVLVREGADITALDGSTGQRWGTYPFPVDGDLALIGAASEHFYVNDGMTLTAYHYGDGEVWSIELDGRHPEFLSGALFLVGEDGATITRLG